MHIMVLNDGETFTDLDGCMIVSCPPNASADEIEEALRELQDNERSGREDDFKVVTVFTDH